MNKVNNRQSTIQDRKEYWEKNDEGVIELHTVIQTSKRIINSENDFAKIYSDAWSNFATKDIKVSAAAKVIFISIANRMDYCNQTELRNAQVVRLDNVTRTHIMNENDISNEKVFYRHLKTLVDVGAIRPALDERGKKRQSVYQVNPLYASKGHWCVNGKYPAYGICDLIQHWDDPNMYTMSINPKGTNKGGC